MVRTKKDRQIELAIQLIEDRFAIGKVVLKQCSKQSPPGEISELAQTHGLPRDICQKLRALAATETGYTKAELAKIFKKFRSAERALTITHFVKLVSVPKGATRDRLTEQAIDEAWSTHRLQAEILAIQGRRQVGGRKPKLVEGKQFEDELARVLWSWNRWLALHLEANQSLRPRLRNETTTLKEQLEKVLGMLKTKAKL